MMRSRQCSVITTACDSGLPHQRDLDGPDNPPFDGYPRSCAIHSVLPFSEEDAMDEPAMIINTSGKISRLEVRLLGPESPM